MHDMRSLRTLLMGLLCVPLAALPTAAGEPANDFREFSALRQRVRPMARRQPAQAIAEYERFLKEHADLDAGVGVAVCSALVDLQYAGAKDPKAALATCDRAVEAYAWHPAGVWSIADKARILNREKRPAEAEGLIEAQWQRVAVGFPDHANAALWQYCTALEQQGKREKLVAALRQGLTQMPQLMDDRQQSPRAWVYERLVAELLRAGQVGEALQWAKLRFAHCAFEDASVRLACGMLARVWAADEKIRAVGAAFAAAQSDPAKVNPLAGVALPPADPAAQAAQLARLQTGDQEMHDRVSMLLRAGGTAPAVAEVCRWRRAAPDLPAGPEMCRILKAADMSLHRANAFARFTAAGEGDNPLPEFLKQQGQADPAPAEEWQVKSIPPPLAADAVAQAFVQPLPPGPEIVFRPESAPVLLGQVASGVLSAEEAWATGALSGSDLIQAVESRAHAADRTFTDQIVRLAVEKCPQDLEPFEARGTQLRMRLADHFARKRDTRAERIYKSLLAEVKQPLESWWEPILQFGQYYEYRGEPEKAIETYLSAERYTTEKKCLGCAYSLAMRNYLRMGNEQGARDLLPAVLKLGYGWATGHAYNDLAGHLMGKGKHEEARKLLLMPVEGYLADEVRILMQGSLIHSYSQTGEMDAARRVYDEMKALRKEIGTPKQTSGDLDMLVRSAEGTLRSAEQWQQQPIQCTTQQVSIAAEWHGAPVTRTVEVRTQRKVPLKVASSDPRVEATVVDAPEERDYGMFRSRLTVEVPSESLDASFDAVLTLTSPEFAGHSAEVKVRVAVQSPLAVVPKALLFGVAEGAKPITRTLQLTSSRPFRLLKVEKDREGLDVETHPQEAAKQHAVFIRLTPAAGKAAFTEGKLFLTTDCPGQEKIEVPYVIYTADG